jgi:S1-C subfamily serine protease
LTVFFMTADEKIYARYGGRDASGADERQSLAGLGHTMKSVLEMHHGKEQQFAPRPEEGVKTIRDIAGRPRHCYHCHQVKEALDASLKRSGKWERELAWRYPPPETVGLTLEVDRGNVVQRVRESSAASRVGLKNGDILRQLNGVPIHSQADVMFALDRAPAQGKVSLTWTQAGKTRSDQLTLADGWRKHDMTWRPSMRRMIPSVPLFGTDLKADERKTLGLSEKQLAFRHRPQLHSWARAAGVLPGDVILGLDGRTFDGLSAEEFRDQARREYLVGDKVRLDLLRQGKKLSLALTIR